MFRRLRSRSGNRRVALFAARLFLFLLVSGIFVPGVFALGVFALGTAVNVSAFTVESERNWAWNNDGNYWYEDNATSWVDDLETVHAVEGIDVNVCALEGREITLQQKVTIAVIDTGIDVDHELLKNIIWSNEQEIPDDGIDNDDNGYIDDVYGWNFYNNTSVVYNKRSYTEDAHGTHVAGIIQKTVTQAAIYGNPDFTSYVNIMSVKTVGGSNGTGTVSNLIKGIEYAEANGAKICNISLGFKKWNDKLYETIKNSNMLFVVAAGNGESDTNGVGFDLDQSPRYPACYDLENIIVVANMRCDGNLHYSSNYGEKSVDLAAPGTQIYSTSTAKSGYEMMTGTSMAAPMVAAETACVLAAHKAWDVLEVKKAILNSSRSLESLRGQVSTGGMPDIAAAISGCWESLETSAATESPSYAVETTDGENSDGTEFSVNAAEPTDGKSPDGTESSDTAVAPTDGENSDSTESSDTTAALIVGETPGGTDPSVTAAVPTDTESSPAMSVPAAAELQETAISTVALQRLTPQIKRKKIGKDRLRISFTAEGAEYDGYYIYCATSRKGIYKIYKKTTKKSIVIRKKRKYYYVAAYKREKKKIVYSKPSRIIKF